MTDETTKLEPTDAQREDYAAECLMEVTKQLALNGIGSDIIIRKMLSLSVALATKAYGRERAMELLALTWGELAKEEDYLPSMQDALMAEEPPEGAKPN